MDNLNLQDIFTQYNEDISLKGMCPEWLANLTRSAATRNITIDLWNAAVDDIRKVASDSVSVTNFVNALGKAFSDGTFAKDLNILKDGIPMSVQDWFNNHSLLFPDIKNITYTDTTAHVEAIVPTGAVVTGSCNEDYSFNRLIDGDLETVAYVPVFNEEGSDTQECSIKINLPAKSHISRVFIYSSRTPSENPIVQTAKYEVGLDTYGYGNFNYPFEISGMFNPLVIDVNSDLYSLMLKTTITKEDSGKLPVYEVKFLKESVTGYYTLEFTNGDSFRIDTYNMSKVLTTIDTLVNKLTQRVDSLTTNDNRPGGYARISKDGHLDKDIIPDIITIENFNIIFDNGVVPTEALIDEALTTAFPEAKQGDYANIVEEIEIPSIENPENMINEQVVRRTYILLGDDPKDRDSWKLKVTDFAYKASHADTARMSYSTDTIKGVDVTIGNLTDFDKSTKSGLFIITDYATSKELS